MPPRVSLAELQSHKLPPAFFRDDAVTVAKNLLGSLLVHGLRTEPRVVRIVETEAYCGPNDAACHARFGRTPRTRTLFGPPGHAYVFLVYGMHECFNVVCFEDGGGHAVLVRGVEPIQGIAPSVRTDGPGRVTRALGITRAHDGASLVSEGLFLAGPIPELGHGSSARVGVGYAGEMADLPWRFFVAGSSHVSKPSRSAIGRGVHGGPTTTARTRRTPLR